MAEYLNEARLRAVVGAYGANSSRWPVADREALAAAAGRSPGAELVAEARELDAILAMAPSAKMGEGLSQAILAAARGTNQVAAPARVVPFRAGPPVRTAPASGIGQWVLLAASLAAGLWIGAAGIADPYGAVDFADGLIVSGRAGEDMANLVVALDVGEPSL